jgi:hypothetical protein
MRFFNSRELNKHALSYRNMKILNVKKRLLSIFCFSYFKKSILTEGSKLMVRKPMVKEEV